MGTSLPPVGVRFQAQGVPQVSGAFDQLSGKARQTGTQISSTFVGASGRVTAFGRSSVQAINATGFAVSQLASSGQVGFKSLASSAAGFASFFGAGGLIASGVISLGLVLADFWQRQRKEIENTAKKVSDELSAAAAQRRAKDQPALVAAEQVGAARRNVTAVNAEIAALVERGETLRKMAGGEATFESQMAALRLRKLDALKDLTEAERQLNDVRNKSTESENKEVQALAASIGARQATSGEIAKANGLLAQARFVLEATANANIEDTATLHRRAEALKVITTLTDAFKKAQDAVTEAEQKRRAALADQVSQLSALSAINKLTGQQVFQLALLYAQLNAELLTGNVSLERRVQLEQQLATIRKAGLQAPPVALTPSSDRPGPLLPGEQAIPGRGGSATRLEVPERLQRFLSADAAAAAQQAAQASIKAAQKAFETTQIEEVIANQLGNALANGIIGGFAQGFERGGIGEGFKQMTAQMLQGLGNAAISFGLASQQIAGLMATIAKSLASLNPFVAIAAGIALVAIGGQLGGAARNSFGGGGRFSSVASTAPIDIRRLIVDPNFRNPVKLQSPPSQFSGRPLVVSTPEGQRVLTENVNRFTRRGG